MSLEIKHGISTIYQSGKTWFPASGAAFCLQTYFGFFAKVFGFSLWFIFVLKLN